MITKRLAICMLVSIAFGLSGCEKQSNTTDEKTQTDEKTERSTSSAEAAPKADTGATGQPSSDPSEASKSSQETAKAGSTNSVVEKSLLWKAEGPNGPVYLFGTVHGGIQGEWSDFPTDARTALRESELVVLEADLDKANPQKAREKMMYPPGESLRAELGDNAFEKLVRELGMPANAIARMRPWAVYTLLVQKWLPPGRAVERLVQNRAKQLDKELAYIETVDEQMEMLIDGITVEMLQDMLDRLEEIKRDTTVMIEAYRNGSADMIENEVFDPEEIARFPELHQAVFEQRNEKWMEDIEGYLERGNVFVAVGAGHLVGDIGLVSRLRKRGYDVTRTAK